MTSSKIEADLDLISSAGNSGRSMRSTRCPDKRLWRSRSINRSRSVNGPTATGAAIRRPSSLSDALPASPRARSITSRAWGDPPANARMVRLCNDSSSSHGPSRLDSSCVGEFICEAAESAIIATEVSGTAWFSSAARKLIPVRVEEYTPTGLLAAIVYIDLVGVDRDEARLRLLSGIKAGRLRLETEPPFPGGR